jgi:hypothetical protein
MRSDEAAKIAPPPNLTAAPRPSICRCRLWRGAGQHAVEACACASCGSVQPWWLRVPAARWRSRLHIMHASLLQRARTGADAGVRAGGRACRDGRPRASWAPWRHGACTGHRMRPLVAPAPRRGGTGRRAWPTPQRARPLHLSGAPFAMRRLLARRGRWWRSGGAAPRNGTRTHTPLSNAVTASGAVSCRACARAPQRAPA